MTDCSVCAEPYTNVLRNKISCNYCSYSACKNCIVKYLLSQVVDAHCMNCRTGWNREFIDQHMTKAFRNGPWKEHRKKMIVIREKALLPNFLTYAASMKKIRELTPILNKAKEDEFEASSNKTNISSKIHNIKTLMIRDPSNDDIHIECLKTYLKAYNEQTINFTLKSVKAERIQNEYNIHHNNYYNNTKGTEKREFIMKCVKDGCRGFLSQAYKCELCNTFVCKDCLIPKKERDDTTHECKKDDIDTVDMIRKDTRPCPKCGIRISKIDGCDQMWCTAAGCGTAFSWNSGKIVSGVVHNPHYYEWLRRNNNGEIPRAVGDVQCGGNIELASITTPLRGLGLLDYSYLKNQPPYKKIFTKITYIHRCMSDLEFERVPTYNVQRDENFLKEVHVLYLMGDIDEAKWTQSIYLKENNLEKKKLIGQVLTTFLNAGTDLMRTSVTILNIMLEAKNANPQYKIDDINSKPFIDLINQFENLRNYINETLETLGRNISAAVPQFNEDWYWLPPTSVEKIRAEKETKPKNDVLK